MSDTKNIFSALVKAQRAFGPVLKDKNNPAFRGSKYADLGACVDAVMGPLNNAGIAVVQKQHPSDGGVCVETVFLHESGESYSTGMLTVPASKQDPQGYGSALTYARRYSLMAACGMAPEDDDGNAASKRSNAVSMAPGVLADWIAHIESSANVGEFKTRAADAESACTEIGDMAALSKIKSVSEAMAARAKTKAET